MNKNVDLNEVYFSCYITAFVRHCVRSWIKLRFSVMQSTVVTGIAKIKVKLF